MFVGCTPAILRPLGLLSALRSQDVFATSLYTGTGASQTITTGFGPNLVWEKTRSVASAHRLTDTLRGSGAYLVSNTTDAEVGSGGSTGFSSTGFNSIAWGGGTTVAAWSFRRAPKFFDIVTYTGDGTSGRVIPHGLGIKPGMIIVKRRDAAADWPVWQAATGDNNSLFLNLTDAVAAGNTRIRAADATSFTVGNSTQVNAAGGTYVAYLLAHDPDTTNGIVQCGLYTTNGSAQATVNLGWQPQLVLAKQIDSAGPWFMVDAARGLGSGATKFLLANSSNAEGTSSGITASTTGFTDNGMIVVNERVVFMAIRAPTT